MHSPKIERIEVAARGDVRRAKLYYLRDRVGKRARVRERRYVGPEEIVEPGLLHDESASPSWQSPSDGAPRTSAVEALDTDPAVAEQTAPQDAGEADGSRRGERARPGRAS